MDALEGNEIADRAAVEDDEHRGHRILRRVWELLGLRGRLGGLQAEERCQRRFGIASVERRERFWIVVALRVDKFYVERSTELLVLWNRHHERRSRLLRNNLTEKEFFDAVASVVYRPEEAAFRASQQQFLSMRTELQFRERLTLIESNEEVSRSSIVHMWEGCRRSDIMRPFSHGFEKLLLGHLIRETSAICDAEEGARRAVVVECHERAREHLFIDFPDFACALKLAAETAMRYSVWRQIMPRQVELQRMHMSAVEQTLRDAICAASQSSAQQLHEHFTEARDALLRQLAVLQLQRLMRATRVRTRLGRQRSKMILVAKEIARERFAAATLVSQAALRARASSKVAHRIRRLAAAHRILSVATGALARLWLHARRQHRRQEAVRLLQRVGHAFEEREELFEIREEMHAASQRVTALRVDAALKIQWIWRRVQTMAEVARRRSRARQLARCQQAALRVQGMLRAMQVQKDHRTLVAAHRRHQILLLQRVIRGGVLRSALTQHRAAKVIASFARAASSTIQRDGLKRSRPAVMIQHAWRSYAARGALSRKRAARDAFVVARIKHNAAVVIQVFVRRHIPQRRYLRRMQARWAERRLALERDAAEWVLDLQRVARGFLRGRMLVSHRRRHVMGSLLVVRCFVDARVAMLAVNERVEKARVQATMARRDEALALVHASLRASLSEKQLEIRTAAAAVARAQQEFCAMLVQRVGRGFATGNGRGHVFACRQERSSACSIIQRVWRSHIARGVAAERQRLQAAAAAAALRCHSSVRLQCWWKRVQKQRVNAARAIQMAFLRVRARLQRSREVRDAIAAMYALRFRNVSRQEYLARKAIHSAADDAWQALRAEMPLDMRVPPHWRVVVPLPAALSSAEHQRRLALEAGAIQGWRELIIGEKEERLLAHSIAHARIFAEERGRCLGSESIARTRLEVARLGVLRSLRHGFRQGVASIFEKKRAAIEEKERVVRAKIEAARVAEAEEHQRSYSILMSMAEALAVASQVANLSIEEESERGAIKLALVREREAHHQALAETTALRLHSEQRQSRFVQNLRAFTKRNYEGHEELTADELAIILDRKLAAQCGWRQEKPTASSSFHIALLPPPPQGLATSTRGAVLDNANCSSAVPEKTWNEGRISVGNNGHLMVADAQQWLRDDTVPMLLHAMARAAVVTRVCVASGDLTSFGVVEIVHEIVKRKLPVTHLDVSKNPRVDDVAALSLAHALDSMPLLTVIDLTGTAVTVPKRQLIAYLLRERAEQRNQPKAGAASSTVTSVPLMLPSLVGAPRRRAIILPPRRYDVAARDTDRRTAMRRLEPLPPSTLYKKQ